jgi:hypothetical protein
MIEKKKRRCFEDEELNYLDRHEGYIRTLCVWYSTTPNYLYLGYQLRTGQEGSGSTTDPSAWLWPSRMEQSKTKLRNFNCLPPKMYE